MCSKELLSRIDKSASKVHGKVEFQVRFILVKIYIQVFVIDISHAIGACVLFQNLVPFQTIDFE